MSGSGLLYGGIGAIVLAILGLAVALMPRQQGKPGVAQALASIDKRYTREPKAGGRRAASTTEAFKLPGWMQDIAVRLSPSGVGSSMQRRLDVAGNPEGWTQDRILAVKALGLVAVGSVGALLALKHPALLVVTGGIGAAAGFFLPDVLLYNAGLKRQQQLALTLPDAIDLLTICVEAGLGFDAALAQVARNVKGPLAAEFARVLQEMQIGKSRGEAMRALAERTTSPELRAFVSALTQSTELGIPVANVLREQAREMRVRRRQRAEAQAQRIPVKITFPLIGCLFPALFVVVLGAGVIQIAHALFHVIK
jgi:tight adherence protein C